MKKIEKKDIGFILAMIFFALANLSRFFDKVLDSHVAIVPILNEYKYAFVFTMLYFVILFLFFIVCIGSCESCKKKTLYYLLCFYSTFAFPMFLSANYFGVMDIYAWMFTFIAGTFLVKERFELVIIPICYLIAVISPMSVLSGNCICLALLLYKFFTKKKIIYVLNAVLCFVGSCIGVLKTRELGVFSTDVQYVLTLQCFIILVVFLSPYLFIAIKFFGGLLKRFDSKKKFAVLCVAFGVLPSAGVYIYLQDYARAFFNTFTYFILCVIVLFASGDLDVMEELEKTKEMIKKHFPVPVLIIVIPFLFMTLWIAGEHVLMTEIFVDN